MTEIVECVLNISEGRDSDRIQAVACAITSTAEVHLLDHSADRDHHRSVFTFVGPPDSTGNAAFEATRMAVKFIDLSRHSGVHPRLGSADVVPFVPLFDTPMDSCVELARRIGRQIGAQLDVPVFLYGFAARDEARSELSRIRRGQISSPDFGPTHPHPTAGISVVGARHILIAFNVFLESEDLAAASRIARAIRESSGGLPAVKALGFYLESRRQVQVSMNLLDYRRTSMMKVYRVIERQARQLNVKVAHSEVVGLVPRDALTDEEAGAMGIDNFGPHRILDMKLKEIYG